MNIELYRDNIASYIKMGQNFKTTSIIMRTRSLDKQDDSKISKMIVIISFYQLEDVTVTMTKSTVNYLRGSKEPQDFCKENMKLEERLRKTLSNATFMGC